ncbi:hypothetical protein ECZU51_27030 [Escherichia coli]|nr:hypothetical protein ECZU51_27030 [Escherichia coli]
MLLNDVYAARQKVFGKLRTGSSGDGRTHDNTGDIRHPVICSGEVYSGMPNA